MRAHLGETSNKPCAMENLSPTQIAQRLVSPRRAGLTPGIEDFSPLADLFAGPPRPAAVLIPMTWVDDQWHLLFIRRTTTMVEHSGQVAFPGGRLDHEDKDATAGALREAHEEVGLAPGDVTVLGNLPPILTISNFLITPVVGSFPWPYTFRLAEVEVSRIFTIPLSWLADPANHKIIPRQLPNGLGQVSTVYFEPYDGELLWGVTAKITLILMHAIL